MSTHRLLLGAHMSIAGGIEKAFERGASIACSAIQIFTKSNRQWGAKALTQQECDAFKAAQKTTGIDVVAHATYLINIGSPDTKVRAASIHALAIEVERCAQLGIPSLILHPGSHLGFGEQECLERIINGLDEVLEKDTSRVHILLETMAGQGSSVCSSFEHIAFILKHSRHAHRLGVCLDTCHVFAAGYDFTTPQKYKDFWHMFDTTIGGNYLKAMHVNDSKKPCGARVDRHEEIGHGHIGLEGFKLLMNDSRLFDVPKILETPKDTLPEYRHNMDVLIGLLSRDTKKKLLIDE